MSGRVEASEACVPVYVSQGRRECDLHYPSSGLQIHKGQDEKVASLLGNGERWWESRGWRERDENLMCVMGKGCLSLLSPFVSQRYISSRHFVFFIGDFFFFSSTRVVTYEMSLPVSFIFTSVLVFSFHINTCKGGLLL